MSENNWINVKEKLPINEDYVLITDGKDVWVGTYENSGYRERKAWGQAYVGCSMVDDTKITHWMRLPQPPKL
jgi:hypothetical protein